MHHNEKRVGLGFVGTGICATELHWPAVHALSDKFEVVAAAGRSEEKAKSFAELVGARRSYTDYRKLLADKEVEAVAISFPFDMNSETSVAALQAGKHVLVEKPMALNMQQAKEMLLESRKTPLVAAVAENWVYWPVIPVVRDHLERGTIGEPRLMIATGIAKMPLDDKYISKSTWRLNTQNGLPIDHGIHLIALLRQMFGPIVAGIGSTCKVREEFTENDTLAYQFRFASGMTGVYLKSTGAMGFPLTTNIVLFGTRGTILFENLYTKLTFITDQGTRVEEHPRAEMGYIAEFDNFYQAIRHGAPVRYSFEDGYLDLQAMLGGTETTKAWEALAFPPIP